MSDPTVAQYLNVVLSTLTLVVVLLIADALQFHYREKLAVLGALCVLPQALGYCGIVGTEVLAGCLLSCIVLLQLLSAHPMLRFGLIGICWAILTLVRPMFLPYVGCVLLVERLCFDTWMGTARKAVISIGCGILVMLPWLVHTLPTQGRLAPLSYNAGFVLHANNNDVNVDGRYMDIDASAAGTVLREKSSVMYSPVTIPEASPQQLSTQDARYLSDAMKWICGHPLEFLKLGVLRIANTFYGGAPDLKWSMMGVDEANLSPPAARSRNMLLGIAGAVNPVLATTTMLLISVFLLQLIPRGSGKRQPVNPEVTIPVVNFMFLVITVFAFEGQPRYAFPFQWLFLLGAVTCFRQLGSSQLEFRGDAQRGPSS